jgi:hypothetical protein
VQDQVANEIAGGYGILSMPIKGPYKYGLVADVYTSSKYQKQGVFSKLGELVRQPIKDEGYDIAVGFPVRPNVIPGHLKVGWQVAFKMPVFISPSVLQLTLSAFSGLNRKFVVVNRKFSGVTKDVAKFLSVSYSQNLDGSKVSKTLEPQYLNWRLSRPGTEYTESIVFKGNEIVAWVISRKVKINGVSIWAVLEIQFASGFRSAVKFAVRCLGKKALKNNCHLIAGCWNRSYAKNLGINLMKGFIHHGEQKVIFRKHSEGIEIPVENQTEFSWLDSDTL